MNHRVKPFIIFQAAILLYFAPVLSYSKNNSAIILSEKDFSSMGYRITKRHKYSGLCQSYEKTNPKDVSIQGIKSIKPIKDSTNTYYRFALIKETYADETIASRNFETIKRLKANSWYSKSCGIKKGVRLKNILYFLSTDVGIFRPELDVVLKKIIDRLDGKAKAE
ncbi:MAG: hypothetical protein L3J51_02600 [Cocleimonas sp.]|nr:hypothetical protein [Cocleimonas sp.]